jgi:hypothetical protein
MCAVGCIYLLHTFLLHTLFVKVMNFFTYKTQQRSIVYYDSKAIPLQAWSGPEGSRKLRFPDFMTTAQDGGKGVSLKHRPPLPQEILLVLISVRG